MKILAFVAASLLSLSLFAAEPAFVGKKLSEHFLSTEPEFYKPAGFEGKSNYGSNKYVHYATVSYWMNCLQFAYITGDKALQDKLIAKFEPFFKEKKAKCNRNDHLDYSIFGCVPLEIYIQNGDKRCLELGLKYADGQWEAPQASGDNFQGNPSLDVLKAYWKDGYSSHTRIWIDDMYMITVLQTQAFRATGDLKYLRRTARQMAMYLDRIQNPDGLFNHAEGKNFIWGRGDGWMAAGMPMVLKYLPENDEYYGKILQGYKKMMFSLLKWQRANGLWGQLVNDPESWDETSGSAMFTFAFLEGVKYGWLPEDPYKAAAMKAFDALCGCFDENYNLKDICIGTGARNEREWYLGRPKVTGDPHGQAPMMWICNSLLSPADPKPQDNPIAVINQNPGLCSIFHYWGFIGDSLCSGEFEYTKPDGKKGYWDCYEYAWGQRMCDLMGVKGEIFSKGGETALGWIDHFWNSNNNKLKNCAKDNPKQAYIIALGVNDSSPKTIEKHNYALGSFDKDVDMNDYNKNAKTFIGCYAGIIQRLKEMQPEVHIFLVTMPRKGKEGYNDAIRAMADKFSNVWLIDLARYATDFYESKEFRTLYKPEKHGHLTAAGYEYTAWEFMTYIDWIIRHNMPAFKEIGFMLPNAPQRVK